MYYEDAVEDMCDEFSELIDTLDQKEVKAITDDMKNHVTAMCKALADLKSYFSGDTTSTGIPELGEAAESAVVGLAANITPEAGGTKAVVGKEADDKAVADKVVELCTSTTCVKLMMKIHLYVDIVANDLDMLFELRFGDKLRKHCNMLFSVELAYSVLVDEDWGDTPEKAYAFARILERVSTLTMMKVNPASHRMYSPRGEYRNFDLWLFSQLSCYELFSEEARRVLYRGKGITGKGLLAKVIQCSKELLGLSYGCLESFRSSNGRNSVSYGPYTKELATLADSEVDEKIQLYAGAIPGIADALMLPAGYLLALALRDEKIVVSEDHLSGMGKRYPKDRLFGQILQGERANSLRNCSQVDVEQKLKDKYEERTKRLIEILGNEELLRGQVDKFYKPTYCTASFLAQIETGQRVPSIALLESLAELYKLEVEELRQHHYAYAEVRCELLHIQGNEMAPLLNALCDAIEGGAKPRELMDLISKAKG